MNARIARSTFSRSCAVLFVMALAAPVRAQGNPATIPTALATAMLGGYGEIGLSPHFVVGRAPADWPSALLPGVPWRTVGGLELGPMRVLVLEAPRSRDVVREYAELLSRAGLKEVTWPGMNDGGFVDGSPRLPRMYCGDSTFVSITPSDSTATARTLVVHRSPNSSRGCPERHIGGRPELLDIPALRSPTGASARRRGSNSGSDYVEQTVQLDTITSVAGVLDHYARQLGAAGWTVMGRPLLDGGTGLQRLSTRDKNGTEWQGALLVITTGPQRQVTLRMAKPGDDLIFAP